MSGMQNCFSGGMVLKVDGSTQVLADPATGEGALECAREIGSAEAELERLQGLLDDTMTRLSGAFSTLSRDAEENRHEQARDVLVSTMQFHDICTQLLAHARGRLASGRALAERAAGLDVDAPIAPGRVPTLHTDMQPGTVELF